MKKRKMFATYPSIISWCARHTHLRPLRWLNSCVMSSPHVYLRREKENEKRSTHTHTKKRLTSAQLQQRLTHTHTPLTQRRAVKAATRSCPCSGPGPTRGGRRSVPHLVLPQPDQAREPRRWTRVMARGRRASKSRTPRRALREEGSRTRR